MESNIKANNPNSILVAADGSEYSHNAVIMTLKNFIRPGIDHLVLHHIYTPLLQVDLEEEYQHKNIVSKYTELLHDSALKKDDYEIIADERITDNISPLQQIHELCQNKGINLLIVGFRGTHGKIGRSAKELSKNIKYLVHQPRIPVLVVKERILREEKNGLTWLVCVKAIKNTSSFKALKSILHFIDPEKDTIIGYLVDFNLKFPEDNKQCEAKFKGIMVDHDIRNYDFVIEQPEEPDAKVSDLIINFAENQRNKGYPIDIIVLGYNHLKYAFNKEADNTTVEVLTKSECSVYFDH